MNNHVPQDGFFDILQALPDEAKLNDVISSSWKNSDLYSLSLISELMNNDVYLLFFEGIVAENTGMTQRAIECYLSVLMIQTEGNGLHSESISTYLTQLDEISPERRLLSHILAHLKGIEAYQKDIRKIERNMNEVFSKPDNALVNELLNDCLSAEVYNTTFLTYDSLKLFLDDSLESINTLSFNDKTLAIIQSYRFFSSLQATFFKDAVTATLEGDEELIMQANDDFVMGIIKGVLLLDVDDTDRQSAVKLITDRYKTTPHIDENINTALYFRFAQELFAFANSFAEEDIRYDSFLGSLGSLDDLKINCSWAAYYIAVLSEFILSANTGSITKLATFLSPEKTDQTVQVIHLLINMMKHDIDDDTDAEFVTQIEQFSNLIEPEKSLAILAEKLSDVIDPIDPDVLSLLLLINGTTVPEASLLFDTIPPEDRLELIALMRFIKPQHADFGNYLGQKLSEITDFSDKKGELYATLEKQYPALKKYIRNESADCKKAYRNCTGG